jgi:hypothetical protein
LLLALAIWSCTTTSSISADEQTRGLAAVHRYVSTNKHWRARDYHVESPERDYGLLVYPVTYLPDLKPPVAPGGGESFWAHYDPKHDKIVRVLHGQ